MATLMLWLKRIALMAVGLLPSSCHGLLTSPWLIAHGSSAAFDLAMVGWVFCAAIVFWAFVLTSQIRKGN